MHTADKDSVCEISPRLAAKEKINGVKVKITIKYSLLGGRWKKKSEKKDTPYYYTAFIMWVKEFSEPPPMSDG